MNRKLIVAGGLAIIVGLGVLARRLDAAGRSKAIDEQLGSSDDFWAWVNDKSNNDPAAAELRRQYPNFDPKRANRANRVAASLHPAARIAMAGYLVDRSGRSKAPAKQTPEAIYPTVFEMREQFEKVVRILVKGSYNPCLEDDAFLDWLWGERNFNPDAMIFRKQHPHLNRQSPLADYPPFDDMSSALAAYLWVEMVHRRQETPKQR